MPLSSGMEAHFILTGLREVPLGPTETITWLGDEDCSIYVVSITVLLKYRPVD